MFRSALIAVLLPVLLLGQTLSLARCHAHEHATPGHEDHHHAHWHSLLGHDHSNSHSLPDQPADDHEHDHDAVSLPESDSLITSPLLCLIESPVHAFEICDLARSRFVKWNPVERSSNASFPRPILLI